MNENIRKFLEKLAKDEELQAKLAKIRDPEEAYKLAGSVQDGFTKEEFIAEMKKIYAEITKDLSEEDVAKLAGGITGQEIASYIFTSVATATAAASLSVFSVGAAIAAT